MTEEQITKLLETYDLEDILDQNDKTLEQVIIFLLDEEFIELPSPLPVDLDL